MNDRELLEMAAKAAGLRVKTWDGHTGVMCAIDNDQYGRMWMPLTDDGDALRLAVGLKIGIEFFNGFGDVRAYFKDSHLEEPYGSDISAATRRAIVRAAAAIGESMP